MAYDGKILTEDHSTELGPVLESQENTSPWWNFDFTSNNHFFLESVDLMNSEKEKNEGSTLHEDNIEQYEEIDPEEVNIQYYTTINDPNKVEQLKGLNPKEIVEALELDWASTFKRFDKASPGVSQRRVKKWIKECIIYGDEHERDILNHTTSAATGALLTDHENGLPVITSMTLAGAFRKAKKTPTVCWKYFHLENARWKAIRYSI